MKIKRFRARTIREALRQVREEQGPDSVILSKHKIADGIEVIAAVDYDEALLHQSMHQTANRTTGTASGSFSSDAVSAFAMAERDSMPAGEEKQTTGGTGEAAAGNPSMPRDESEEAERSFKLVLEKGQEAPIVLPEPSSGDLHSLREIHQELQVVREAIEKQYAELRWDDLQRREPRFAEVIRRFSLMELSRPLTESIIHALDDHGDQKQVWRNAIGLLARRLPLATEDLCAEGGIYALVGPTGAGKTSCVAKLATRFAMSHGIEQIGLVTTDGERIGAQEQLFRFGKVLGVPVQVATDGATLSAALGQLSSKRLVLIDTAGFAPRDEESFCRLQEITGPSPTIQTLLTLPANAQTGSLEEAIRVFDRMGLDGVITTKLDEATSLGGLLSLLIAENLLVCYVTDGQDIPEDIRPGAKNRADFVSQAVKLACTSPRDGVGREGVSMASESIETEYSEPLKGRLRVTANG